MAEATLAIKLKCASWPQLATIYKRDLSHGVMFLRAATPPPLGTEVRIDLTLPSATVIALSGVVQSHVNDPQRGSGVELKLAPIPQGSVWLIESALASEQKRRAGSVAQPLSGAQQMTGAIPTITEGAEITAAEQDLIKALVSEAESLRKLNPFLVLGVGYEATDGEVRAAFGELTKRYHPDRFARYESDDLRQVAAEIFILIRDAYRRLGDAVARAQVLHSLGKPAPGPRAVPGPPRTPPTVPPPRASQRLPLNAPLPPAAPGGAPQASPASPATQASVAQPSPAGPPAGPAAGPATGNVGTAPTTPIPVVRPGVHSSSGVRIAPPRPLGARRPPGVTPPPPPSVPLPPAARRAATDPGSPTPASRRAVHSQQLPVAPGESADTTAIEALIDQGRLDDALAGFRLAAKKAPHDRNARAGVELCEGLLALAARDRLEAAQRFEAALEIDPSNERAARELADMRRQATNERKGLLSRLMGKKEP